MGRVNSVDRGPRGLAGLGVVQPRDLGDLERNTAASPAGGPLGRRWLVLLPPRGTTRILECDAVAFEARMSRVRRRPLNMCCAGRCGCGSSDLRWPGGASPAGPADADRGDHGRAAGPAAADVFFLENSLGIDGRGWIRVAVRHGAEHGVAGRGSPGSCRRGGRAPRRASPTDEAGVRRGPRSRCRWGPRRTGRGSGLGPEEWCS